MNINCIVDHIKIKSDCLQNIEKYNLGTQGFFNSVITITISYYKQENNVFEDLDIVHKYFKNLAYVNLVDFTELLLNEIIQILKNCKVNIICFDQIPHSMGEYQIESEDGCLVIHDSKNKLFLNYGSLSLISKSMPYKIQGEYQRKTSII